MILEKIFVIIIMNIFEIRKKYYQIMRIIATFIIAPFLIYKGYKLKQNIILIIGVGLFVWDGLKILDP